MYDISVLNHPGMDNVVADILYRMTMDSVSYIEKAKKNLVRDVHRFARLGVRFEDSPNSDFMVHQNSESSLVVKVNSKQDLDQPLIEFKESVLGKINQAFS